MAGANANASAARLNVWKLHSCVMFWWPLQLAVSTQENDLDQLYQKYYLLSIAEVTTR